MHHILQQSNTTDPSGGGKHHFSPSLAMASVLNKNFKS
jgi:hypothetical protein